MSASTAPSRLRWVELPDAPRTAIEATLGAPVAAEVPQTGGFSPGLASRLRLADGRRVFVKAVNGERNTHAPVLYRREASVMAALPGAVPAPALRHTYDDGDWVALVLDDIDGRHASEPWNSTDLRRVLSALTDLAHRLTPSPAKVPDVRDDLADNYRSWRRLADDHDTAGLDPWVAEHLSQLVDLEAGWTYAAEGDTLLHADLRADNILLTPDTVAIIDWPYAVHGVVWLDLLLLLVSVAATTSLDPEPLWTGHPLGRAADPNGATAVLAAVAGDFTYCSRQPAPRNLPHLRRHQQQKAAAALSWLRNRTSRVATSSSTILPPGKP
ncbi:MAG: phosphotransferase family protein [Pseudonocardia sp.]